MNPGLLCNDIHSRLNSTTVSAVSRPLTLEEVAATVRQAAAADLPVSICGARHAMGGQQFGSGTILMDMTGLDFVHAVDPVAGTVEAGAGVVWPDLVRKLHEQQAGDPAPWTIRQKQTGADHLTLGGALAANIHGRGLAMRPLIDDIEAFTLIDASGGSRRCSRAGNPELFRLAIGGYGCFGIIVSVCLRLSRRETLVRTVEILNLEDLMPAFGQRIAAGHRFGDFQFSIDESSPDFLNKGVFSCYAPAGDDARIPDSPPELGVQGWKDLVYLAHADRAKCFEVYSGYYLATRGALYASDTHQMSVYLDDYHVALDQRLEAPCPGSEMISELYVPRPRLVEFMHRAAECLRRSGSIVIYGTVRLILRDAESFLAWARGDHACVIFNLHTDHHDNGIQRSADTFRELIDIALDLGGSFYLTYHRWATRDQVIAAYPDFSEFVRLKRLHDPRGRFQSEWWRHYSALFPESRET